MMYKFVRYGPLLLLFVFMANSRAEDKFGLALKIGPNFANMRVKEKSTGRIINTNVSRNPSFLLEAELVLSSHLSYVTGVQYLVHGYSAPAIDSIYVYEYFRRAKYLSLPQKLRIFIHHQAVQSYVSIGVNAETLLSARFRAEFADPTIPDYDVSIKSLYNDLTFTPEIDAGLRVPVRGFYLTFEATYARGAENVNNPDVESLATHARRIHDIRLLFGISRYIL